MTGLRALKPGTISCADVVTAGGDHVELIPGLQPAWPGAVFAGPAFTAAGVSGDNLVLHRALAAAPPGSVIVAALDGDTAAGHWGELMCVAAIRAGLAGLVVSGTVRDLRQIESRQFPVFHRGVGPRPAGKAHPGRIGEPVSMGGVNVTEGDFVVADADGIAVIPRELTDAILESVVENQRREADMVTALEQGMTTMEVLGLD